jgi:hypothetical protein
VLRVLPFFKILRRNDMWKLFVLCVLLTGCADSVEIRYHETDQPTLDQIAGRPAGGAAIRYDGDWNSPPRCEIYLLPATSYPSPDCYEKMIQHEERHCIEGSYHENTPEGSAAGFSCEGGVAVY